MHHPKGVIFVLCFRVPWISGKPKAMRYLLPLVWSTPSSILPVRLLLSSMREDAFRPAVRGGSGKQSVVVVQLSVSSVTREALAVSAPLSVALMSPTSSVSPGESETSKAP